MQMQCIKPHNKLITSLTMTTLRPAPTTCALLQDCKSKLYYIGFNATGFNATDHELTLHFTFVRQYALRLLCCVES